MKKLLLLFLFGTMAYAQPNINPPMDLFVCESSFGGVATFDLTVNNMVMLAGQDASLYTITYYETQAEANNGQNAITNPYNYTSGTNTLFARVTETANTANYVVAAFSLMVSPLPMIPNLPAIEQCGVIFDLTTNIGLIDGSDNISYYTTLPDAEADMNAIANPQSYVSETSAIVWVRAINNAGCYVIKEQQLVISGGNFEVAAIFEAQTITLVNSGEGYYQYSLDNGPWQESPTFYNVSYGNHTIIVQDQCGNMMMLTIIVTPMIPTGEAEQTVEEGATLADLEVEGDNIQWYDNSGEMPDFPDGNDEPLPLTTLLTDNTTYYASQTIDGVESAERLAVTVNLILGTENNLFTSLRFYPNPATNILNIENTNGIDRVSIANTLGQKMFTKAVNNNAAQVDVSSLSKGVYFVTVTSGSASKTIKIVKE